MNRRKQHLDLLISSQEEQEKRGNLSDIGKYYLKGLKRARGIIFGEKIRKQGIDLTEFAGSHTIDETKEIIKKIKKKISAQSK